MVFHTSKLLFFYIRSVYIAFLEQNLLLDTRTSCKTGQKVELNADYILVCPCTDDFKYTTTKTTRCTFLRKCRSKSCPSAVYLELWKEDWVFIVFAACRFYLSASYWCHACAHSHPIAHLLEPGGTEIGISVLAVMKANSVHHLGPKTLRCLVTGQFPFKLVMGSDWKFDQVNKW